jgi:hypothetical protein
VNFDDGTKIARFESDYGPGTWLALSRTMDGDIIISIFGNDECRIAASGGQLRGEKLVKVTGLFSQIIDELNEKEAAK